MSTRSRSRGLAVGLLTVSCALALVGAKAVLFPHFRFPTPTGPYAIGTATRHWVDPTRRDILAPDPEQPRELMVQFWYPAERSEARPAPYLDDAAVVTPALARIFGVPRMALDHLAAVRTHAVAGAPVADDPTRFPVVLLLSGLGGFRQSTTFLAEELVSQGFVVVGIDLPYAAAAVAFPDGRVAEMGSLPQMKTLSTQSYLPAAEAPLAAGVRLENGMIPFLGEDTSFVIDRLEELEKGDADPTAGSLAGRLDLSRIGIAGVSLGGLVAGEVARADHRIVAALILDAPVPLRTVTTGLDVPTMWITRPPSTMRLERERSGGWPEDEIEAHHRTIRTTYDTLRAPGYIVQVPRISHIDFTDAPLWSPLVRWLRLSGPRDGRYAHRVITDHAMAFLEHHLRARALTPLDEQQADRLRAAHPGVTLELHHPPTD